MRSLHAICVSLLLLGGACSDSPAVTPGPDLGGSTPDAVADATSYPPNYDVEKRCYTSPTSHVEIINSCPTVGVALDRLEKSPRLPLLDDDGTRPPLP